jgi:chromosome segregation ATPase
MSKTISYPKVLKSCCTLAVYVAITVLLGCSSGVKRSDKAVSSAESLKRECVNLQGQITKTIQSLDGVVAAKDADLSTAYKSYVSEMKTLKSQTKKVVSQSQKLKKSSQGYLDAWEKSMQEVENPELRKQAAERRAQASARFEETKDEFDRIRSDYELFAKNLREIEVALEHDLNPAGVTSIEGVIEQAKKDSEPMKKDIDTIIAALDKVTAALSRKPVSG